MVNKYINNVYDHYQENANKNQKDLSCHTYQDRFYEKKKDSESNMEKENS